MPVTKEMREMAEMLSRTIPGTESERATIAADMLRDSGSIPPENPEELVRQLVRTIPCVTANDRDAVVAEILADGPVTRGPRPRTGRPSPSSGTWWAQ